MINFKGSNTKPRMQDISGFFKIYLIPLLHVLFNQTAEIALWLFFC